MGKEERHQDLQRRDFLEGMLGAGALGAIGFGSRAAEAQAPADPFGLSQSVSTATRQDREEYLKKLLQILPHSPFFNKWLEKTGELPPDFDALPRVNTLPDPLQFLDGRRVSSREQWPARRAEILQLSEKYVWGTFPPKPKIDRVVVLNETHSKGFLVRNVRLQFGPGGKGRLRVQLVIPDGAGPFPVLVCNTLEGWAPAALRRGYISAGYAANDFMDDAAPLAQLYPEYTFALLPRR
ncbi:MAG TPA: hypothetical protein VF283_19105, partial [Bryobacteraceae bacterium]